jgi:hypothetical protein
MNFNLNEDLFLNSISQNSFDHANSTLAKDITTSGKVLQDDMVYGNPELSQDRLDNLQALNAEI